MEYSRFTLRQSVRIVTWPDKNKGRLRRPSRGMNWACRGVDSFAGLEDTCSVPVDREPCYSNIWYKLVKSSVQSGMFCPSGFAASVAREISGDFSQSLSRVSSTHVEE